jgi:hypothetical protein
VGGGSRSVRARPRWQQASGAHVRVAAWDRGDGDTDRWARGHSNGRRGQNGLNRFKIQTVWKCSKFSKFDRSKFDLPELQKFEVKYGFEDLKKVNNFLHRNFFRFGMEFKLRIREISKLEFVRIHYSFFLELWTWMKFETRAAGCT